MTSILVTLILWLVDQQALKKGAKLDQKELADSYLAWLARQHHEEILGFFEDSRESLEEMLTVLLENRDGILSIGQELSRLSTLIESRVSLPAFDMLPEPDEYGIEILTATVGTNGQIAVLDQSSVQIVIVVDTQSRFEGKYYVDAVIHLEEIDFIRHVSKSAYTTTKMGDDWIKDYLAEASE